MTGFKQWAAIVGASAWTAFVVAWVHAQPAAQQTSMGKERTLYDFAVKDIDGKEVKLDRYRGSVCIIVNVASKCGLTEKSYVGLEAMYRKYKDQGLRVLAFPANNFGSQEPGTNAEIKQFCASKYQTSFDLFEKISVTGDDKAPLYKFLTEHSNKEIAGKVDWNFQKYLVGRDGAVLSKFGPRTAPDDPKFVAEVEKALASGKSPTAPSSPTPPKSP